MIVVILVVAGVVIAFRERQFHKTTSSSSKYKLALLVGGDTTDDGLNDQGVQVAQWIGSTYGWTVSVSQDVAYSDQGALMTSYAQEGYNVIWTDGNQFIGTTEAIAAQFPNVDFIMTPTYDGDNITSNVVALGAQNQAPATTWQASCRAR